MNKKISNKQLVTSLRDALTIIDMDICVNADIRNNSIKAIRQIIDEIVKKKTSRGDNN